MVARDPFAALAPSSADLLWLQMGPPHCRTLTLTTREL